MSYGVEITNDGSGFFLNSQYENFALISSVPGTAARNSPYPPVGYTDELIFARPTTRTLSQHGVFLESQTTWGDYGFFSAPDSFTYYGLTPFSTVSSSGGYGLEIFKSNGDLAFSSDYFASQGFSIEFVGSTSGYATDPYFPSQVGSVPDLHKYYCLVNPTFWFASRFGGGANVYTYLYDGPTGTAGRIKVDSSGAAVSFHFCIIKETT